MSTKSQNSDTSVKPVATDDIRKQAEAEAEAYMIDTVVEGGNGAEMQNCMTDYIAGYLAAMSKAHVLVNAIDAIEGGLDDAYDLKNIAREALAEFRKGRGRMSWRCWFKHRWYVIYSSQLFVRIECRRCGRKEYRGTE